MQHFPDKLSGEQIYMECHNATYTITQYISYEFKSIVQSYTLSYIINHIISLIKGFCRWKTLRRVNSEPKVYYLP